MSKGTASPTPAGTSMAAPGTSAITPARLEHISIEVERLCGAVRGAARLLAFGDEPSRFRALIERSAP
jgi:hypothetical protein